MKRNIIKKIANKRERKIRNKNIKRIRKTINSYIYSASLNGCYSVKILDNELGNCYKMDKEKCKLALEIAKEQRGYYENKGFTFETKGGFVYEYIYISWGESYDR